jgi:hypothetical protein
MDHAPVGIVGVRERWRIITMTKFKVGQVVQVHSPDEPKYHGERAYVTDVLPYERGVLYRLQALDWFEEWELRSAA